VFPGCLRRTAGVANMSAKQLHLLLLFRSTFVMCCTLYLP
jgi:hypothetical protein